MDKKTTEEKIIKLYKGKVAIKFITDHADKHEYYDPKGNRIFGTTYFTGVIDKSDALIGWAVKSMGEYLLQEAGKGNDKITGELISLAKVEFRRIKQEAMDIGKAIHAWIEQWIAGENPEIPDKAEIRNGVTAFMDFQNKHKVKWLESERLVYSKKYNYPGTADAIGKIGKDLVLFDFKSSKPSSISKDGIYPEHSIQAAGYQLAYEEETGKEIAYRIIITLDKETGEFRFRKFEDNEKDKKAFVNCLQLRRRINELKI